MDINKKYIIIFGTLILSLIIITGAITYYKENQEGNVYSILPILEEKEYSIWCYGDGAIYNCSNKGSFEPGESVAITVNLAQFNNIPYNPYFLCWKTNLQGGLEKQCIFRSASLLRGFTLENKTVPQNKDIFTLIELVVYPNNEFNEKEGITIMDLTGKLIK